MNILCNKLQFSSNSRAISSRPKSLLKRNALGLAALFFAQVSTAAVCEYEIKNEWNNGFGAEISVTNNGDQPLADWSVALEWADGATIADGWNATYDCSGSACDITGPNWKRTIEPGATYSFGFNGQKAQSGAAATAPVFGGDCIAAPVGPDVLWVLNGGASSIKYMSLKKGQVAELNTFKAASGDPALAGSIDKEGHSILSIDLNDVSTNVEIRNQRVKETLFEVDVMPTAFFEVEVNTADISSMAVGSTKVTSLSGGFSLHAVRQDITVDVLLTKLSESELRVSTLKPVMLKSENFDMSRGIEALRLVANLSSISRTVPVYFDLRYSANDSVDTAPAAKPDTPSAPTSLEVNFDAVASTATLTWQDNSDNESGFIIRRKPVGGVWSTSKVVAGNVNSYEETLPETGEFEYKVIALNEGVPSTESNIALVTVTEADPIALGEHLYTESCSTCHGVDAEGNSFAPALDTPRDVNQMIEYIIAEMPIGDPTACDRECAESIAAYVQTLWEVAISCDRSVAPVSYGARQLKILTKAEYQNSLVDLFSIDFNAGEKLSADDKIGLFSNKTHSSIVASSYSNYLLVAEEVAQWAYDKDFAPALTCSSFDAACADNFIDNFAHKVFRRPLTAEETNMYRDMANGTHSDNDVKEGLKMAVEAMLSSPQFLYRHELGEPNPDNSDIDSDAFELTSYEMASFLSYTFAGTTPDDILLAAAANNELRTDAGILAQAQRLAENSKGVMGDFIGEWLSISDLEMVTKDAEAWPGFSSVAGHMEQEAKEVFAHVMLDENESFASFYYSDYTFLNEELASYYGIPGVTGSNMRKVSSSNRSGILANGAFMSRWGESLETSPILRAVRVRNRMLCQEVPPPPAGTFEAREEKLAELSDLLQDPATTNRVKYHRLTEDAPCTTCHTTQINPLGFGMEDFDTVGRVRDADLNGNMIDAMGELFAPNDYSKTDEVEPFTGAVGLGEVLATLPSAQACIPKQMFRYFTGVGHDQIDPSNPEGAQLAEAEKVGYACAIEDLTNSMMNNSPRSMLESFGVLEAVRYRKAWSRN